MDVVCDFAPELEPKVVAQLVAQLAERGVRAEARSERCDPAFALALFAAPDARALHAVEQLSAQGRRRVLALSLSRDALPGPSCWQLLGAGASEVLHWTGEDELTAVLARLSRWREVEAIVASERVRKHLVGQSPAWLHLLRQVVEVACFTRGNVLITGESGTGKELVSRLIHTLDPRVERRELVVLDCTTIVPELIGSELFGHERGAFTGATGPRDGAFALSDKGTLFLDEIGELPLSLQPQLLRVIQERSYKRVGGNQWSSAHFRLVCATHRDFAAEIEAGRFRADLYYRIATCKLALPPLRARREDIGPLAEHFLRELSPEGETPELTPAVRELLEQRDYPGNVRELRQLMSRIAARHVGTGPVSVGDIPDDERPSHEPAGARWQTAEFEAAIQRALALGAPLKDLSQYLSETAVRLAVDEEDGNLQRAARRLGVTDRALQMRRAKLDAGRDAA